MCPLCTDCRLRTADFGATCEGSCLLAHLNMCHNLSRRVLMYHVLKNVHTYVANQPTHSDKICLNLY